MEKEALKRIFEFLQEKEQQNLPFLWKHKNNIPLTEEDLNVKGNLDLRHTKITSLPKGLKVGGNLNVAHTKITSLPEGIKVGNSLFLSHTPITSLPEGLKVGGNLYLSSSTIASLPKGLEVGYDLIIFWTTLQKYSDDELREMIKPGFIKGGIYRR